MLGVTAVLPANMERVVTCPVMWVALIMVVLEHQGTVTYAMRVTLVKSVKISVRIVMVFVVKQMGFVLVDAVRCTMVIIVKIPAQTIAKIENVTSKLVIVKVGNQVSMGESVRDIVQIVRIRFVEKQMGFVLVGVLICIMGIIVITLAQIIVKIEDATKIQVIVKVVKKLSMEASVMKNVRKIVTGLNATKQMESAMVVKEVGKETNVIIVVILAEIGTVHKMEYATRAVRYITMVIDVQNVVMVTVQVRNVMKMALAWDVKQIGLGGIATSHVHKIVLMEHVNRLKGHVRIVKMVIMGIDALKIVLRIAPMRLVV